MNNLLDNFGTNCFSEKNLKNRVPDYVVKKFLEIKNGKAELTLEIADIIANAIKMWALEKGATHYTHWFQPLTDLTAEKHESFISINSDGTSMAKFSGKDLMKGESDTSSFPNGGLRSTFEARGYTAWDISSPMFLKGEEGSKTLYIPTAFIAYNGEALDKKVPLLRSINSLKEQALKIQKLSIAALMVSAVISGQVFAEEKALDEKAASYAVGALMGGQMKDLVDAHKEVITYDNARILDGLKDALEGKVDVRKDENVQKTLEAIEAKLVSASKAKAEAIAKSAQDEGDKYRADFAKGKDVKTTKSGLLYKIENAGKGEAIKATDTVKVHYTGKLPNGKVFDSSVERGQPVEFQLNQVIPGWTEGLQLVKKGGKIQLVIPPALGYGKQGAGASIPPNSTLIFDVEVLDVNPKSEK